jgi:hypothetical protein
MRFQNLLPLLLFPILSLAQSNIAPDTSGKRPDLSKMAYTDIRWMKAPEGNAFWFYYKPTQYFFQDKEFETIPMENGDFLIYIYEFDKYVLLTDFKNRERNKEFSVELASNRPSVFVRLNRVRFVIYDRGQYVDNLERIGINTIHQVVYKSGRTDKRYWISESDFLYGPMSVAIGILSE